MKKHLLGLAIFSFIFASFAVAFALLYAPKILEINEVKRPIFENDTRNRCDYSKRRNVSSSFKFTQATLQKNNRQFNAIIESENLNQDSFLNLHFFVNDGKGVEHIMTETSKVRKIYIEGKVYWRIEMNLGEWLNKYDRKSNFYVIPELLTDEVKFHKNQEEFDATKAVSVLWIDERANVKIPLK